MRQESLPPAGEDFVVDGLCQAFGVNAESVLVGQVMQLGTTPLLLFKLARVTSDKIWPGLHKDIA
jgi:hypothetical protein